MTGSAGESHGVNTAASTGVVDFFAIEASEYLEQLDAVLARADEGARAPDADPLARNARALRGAATMARHTALADLASAIETVAVALRDGRTSWTPNVADALTAAVDVYKTSIRRVRDWTPDDTARTAARAADLRGLGTQDGAARPAGVVPIASLFYDDAGPHVMHRNPRPPITADIRFRQAAVPLASTLRRLIGEARHATDDASRRAAGDDLRGAIRDLGELAESYDIRPVVSFARAREHALAALDERTLDLVDGAAQALVESAGTAWARATPPSATGIIEPPSAPTPAPTPAAAPAVASPSEPPAPPTPPSGQALVALLETSIAQLDSLGDDTSLASPPAGPSAPRAADDSVPIEALVYRGRAALERARHVRDELRTSRTPDPELLAELYDLLDLAALDETVHA